MRHTVLAILSIAALCGCDDSVSAPGRGLATSDPVTRFYSQGTRLYLEHIEGPDTLRAGLASKWGAGIVELSLNGLNFVNSYDPGREIQLALYDGTHHYDACAACTGSWGWNPVQAGDRHGNGSVLLDQRMGPDALYVKIQPIHWSPETNGGWFGHAAPADVVIEQWVAPVPGHQRAIRLTYRLTHLGADRHGYTGQQEFPAVYVNREYHRFVHYTGSAPWSGDAVLFESLPQLFIEEQRLSYAAEWWGAFVDERNIGLTIFAPGSFPYMRSGIQPGTTGSAGSGAVYTHPYTPFGIGPLQVLEGDVYLLLGDYRDSRETIYDLQKSISVQDIAAPILSIDPTSSTLSRGGRKELLGWAYDNVAVSKVEVLVGDSLIGTARLGQLRPEVRELWNGIPSNPGFRFVLEGDDLELGEHTLLFRAHDSAGNSTDSALPIRIVAE